MFTILPDKKSLIPGENKYKSFYMREYLGGGVIPLKNGNVVECNSYSSSINIITPDLKITTNSYDDKNYKELNTDLHYSAGMDEYNAKYYAHTEYINIIGFRKYKNILRYGMNMGVASTNNKLFIPKLFVDVFDEYGNYLTTKTGPMQIYKLGNNDQCGIISNISNPNDESKSVLKVIFVRYKNEK